MKIEPKQLLITIMTMLIALTTVTVAVAEEWPHPDENRLGLSQIENYKAQYDDPRPYMNEIGPKKVLPADMYKRLSFDVTEMKKAWVEVVGLRAMDLVGKIAPEIKPGKYTYKDVQNNPAFKELMWPELYKRIKPGGPPLAGSIPEFEIVPTRQYYFSIPIANETLKNYKDVQLDKDGYLKIETYKSGIPFPRPSGGNKGMQIAYNIVYRYDKFGGNLVMTSRFLGYNKKLNLDYDGAVDIGYIRMQGRCTMPPYGYLDERAEKNQERLTLYQLYRAPRDQFGLTALAQYYQPYDKFDNILLYIPSLRRARKLSATDTQDPIGGGDVIYDDGGTWSTKLSPVRYPWKVNVVEEREFLVPAPSWDGSEYITKKGLELRGMKFERRPMYVVDFIQQDPNYVYSRKRLYIDKETFLHASMENYDQKGRLYRTLDFNYGFYPEMGAFSWGPGFYLALDHIDEHSTLFQTYDLPAYWSRGDISMQMLIKKSK
jgi:uncharacterized protein DUF1329